jgi:hypothetical protein
VERVDKVETNKLFNEVERVYGPALLKYSDHGVIRSFIMADAKEIISGTSKDDGFVIEEASVNGRVSAIGN